MRKLGFVGFRGMVGSVLLERMIAENDFAHFETSFFSESLKGKNAPVVPNGVSTVLDSKNIEALMSMDVILTCQGSDFTLSTHPQLRKNEWKGYWIDAASSLRMEKNAIICLDPVNEKMIKDGLNHGVKDFIGGNCTVSLLLMGIGGLINEGVVEWITSMTYQAASGAGAQTMTELLMQMNRFGESVNQLEVKDILSIEKDLVSKLKNKVIPTEVFGNALAGGLIPWIDAPMSSGQTKEEWKGMAEANKILGSAHHLPLDGTCVRVGAFRSHSQALTIKLNKEIDLEEIEQLISSYNSWVDLVPNDRSETVKKLNPFNYSGTLNVGVGRVRKMTLGSKYLNIFTLGDQLLWGAAEPLRRMLRLI